ncbi:MAG: eL32 family ribosomal protein [Candidatus Diapherotrites archaeon]
MTNETKSEKTSMKTIPPAKEETPITTKIEGKAPISTTHIHTSGSATTLPKVPKTKEEKKKKEEKNKTEALSGKPAKKKGAKAVWVKKIKVVKTKEAKNIMELLSNKWKPVFWGRFGKKNIRTRKNEKYDKWRKPRGEDMQQRRDDGAVVNTGYRTPKATRGIHPSGYREIMVYTKKDLEMIQPTHAARISSTIGRKKRIELIQLANEKKIHVLN